MEYRITPNVIAVQSDEHLILLDVRAGRFYAVTFAGAVIVKAMINGIKAEEITDLLSERFHVPKPELEVDTLKFLTELANAGLCQLRIDRPRSSTMLNKSS